MKQQQNIADTELFKEDFAAMLAEIPGATGASEGSVVKGRVVDIQNDLAIIDIGLKSEGRIPLKEFGIDAQGEICVGDLVDVYLERLEDRHGDVMLSREKARREEAWIKLEALYKEGKRVMGIITERVKGGFKVDLAGAIAFLPGSQVDIRPVRDAAPLMGVEQPFEILKMDRSRGNIVVSRRTVLEESRAEARSELVAHLEEGQIVQGVVKNITDYGAFVDLGGVDGLLHITDMGWKKINHPSESVEIGQKVEVQIIRFNKATQRISLGMKQLTEDPWQGVETRYVAGSRYTGTVASVVDYGAFVELEPGIEGLVHVSEMGWGQKNVLASSLVSPGQSVEVLVLDVDLAKRRISLGMKQCQPNPWQILSDSHPAGTSFTARILRVTDTGLVVELPGTLEGFVHMSDLSWDSSGEDLLKTYKPDAMIQVKVLDIEPDQEKVQLGVKQLAHDPFETSLDKVQKGSVVTCVVAQVLDQSIEVTFGEDHLRGIIKKTELARERSEQKPSRFAVGEKVDAKITQIDRETRRVILSIKAREVDEHKKAMEAFGSSDSGASLGDILGAAISKAQTKKKKSEASSEA